MTLISNFEATFGEEMLEWYLNHAGHHAAIESPPEDEHDRLIFSLLETLGWKCFKFNGSPCCKLTEQQIKDFIIANIKDFKDYKGAIPDYLALECGTYNFIQEAKYELG